MFFAPCGNSELRLARGSCRLAPYLANDLCIFVSVPVPVPVRVRVRVCVSMRAGAGVHISQRTYFT